MYKILIFSTMLFLGIEILLSQTATPPATGDGSAGNPYQVVTLNNLYWITQNTTEWDKHYIQTKDIDASTTSGWDSGAGFYPIGNSPNYFTGSYDGKEHTIDGLFINRSSTDNVGLFGYTSGAEINNLGATNVNITGQQYTGSIVGYNDNVIINHCYSTGSVNGSWRVGGLIGYNTSSSTIDNCYSNNSVNGSASYIGGLVGQNDASSINDSYATGTVYGDFQAGGLVGMNLSSTVNNCYSTGSVTVSNNTSGGLVGDNAGSSNIINSYSTGNVSGILNVGGLAGGNSATITNSFWDTESSGLSNIDDGVGNQTRAISGVYGKTTSDMKNHKTYTDVSWSDGLSVAWDFETNPFDDVANDDHWDMDYCSSMNDRYPILSWHNGSTVALPEIPSGSGAEGDPYQISTVDHIVWIRINEEASIWDAYFEQTADIDASSIATCDDDKGFSPIGNSTIKFGGFYDGQGHTIDGLVINRPTEDYIGLFGHTEAARIENLGMTNVNITGDNWVGSLVGINTTFSTISNSYVSGTVYGSWHVGGLVGFNTSSTISNSYVSGTIDGSWYVGGLVGYNRYSSSTISNSYTAGSTSGSHYVGGLVGINDNSTIDNSYSSGSVTGSTKWAGGLVGINNNSSKISNSYATGSVIGALYTGGLVGENSATVENSFWDTGSSGQTTSAGGTGKTTTEMKNDRTFTDVGWSIGLTTAWDFVKNPYDDSAKNDYWGINGSDNSGYPFLIWQGYSTDECTSGSIIYNTETDKFNFCENGYWIEK